MAISTVCSIPTCGKGGKLRRGWCDAHYRRWIRNGDPLAGRASWSSGSASGSAQLYFRETVLAYEGDECLIWPFSRARYGIIGVGGKYCLVHRLVCDHVHGPAPTPKHEAAHSCGKGTSGCVTKRHLSWKTHAENEADKLLHGTTTRGETNWTAKLTESSVREIRALKGMGTKELAQLYGVGRSQIYRILNRENWDWLV